MDKSTSADSQLASTLAQFKPMEHHGLGNSSLADATAKMTADANEIGMTGTTGSIKRAAIVINDGLSEAPAGAVENIKEKGVGGVALMGAESAAVGVGLRMLMNTPGARVAEVAALALGAQFVATTAPKFYDAVAQGERATTFAELKNAGHAFGRASGELAVDSAIGLAGYHAGSRSVIGLRSLKAPSALMAEMPAHAAPEAPVGHESAPTHDAVSEAAKPTDKVGATKIVSPEHTLSMRELAENNDPRFGPILDTYYGKLEKAFPDASEIESKETYRDYLHDKEFPWDMLVLRDKEGTVIGGVQSQTVDVGGQELNKAIWAEHIWLDPEARSFPNFMSLLRTAQGRWTATGSDAVFMEFNDRAKMSLQQQIDDASAGLTPEARETIWGRVGLSVLGDASGRVAPYAQPAMGDGAPVEYLSMGFANLKGKNFEGQSMPIGDYLKLMRAAHGTIPEVNLETDPTVLDYTAKLKTLTDAGQTRLQFAPLKDTHIERIINQRFVGDSQPTAGDK